MHKLSETIRQMWHDVTEVIFSCIYDPWALLLLGDAGAIQEAVLKLYHDPQQLGVGIERRKVPGEILDVLNHVTIIRWSMYWIQQTS